MKKSLLILIAILFLGIFSFGSWQYITFARERNQCASKINGISVGFTINLQEDAPNSLVKKFGDAIHGLEDVRSVEVITAVEALDRFKEQHKDEPTIRATLEELDKSPFRDSLEVTVDETADDAKIISSVKILAQDMNLRTLVSSGSSSRELKKLLLRIFSKYNKFSFVVPSRNKDAKEFFRICIPNTPEEIIIVLDLLDLEER